MNKRNTTTAAAVANADLAAAELANLGTIWAHSWRQTSPGPFNRDVAEWFAYLASRGAAIITGFPVDEAMIDAGDAAAELFGVSPGQPKPDHRIDLEDVAQVAANILTELEGS